MDTPEKTLKEMEQHQGKELKDKWLNDKEKRRQRRKYKRKNDYYAVKDDE